MRLRMFWNRLIILLADLLAMAILILVAGTALTLSLYPIIAFFLAWPWERVMLACLSWAAFLGLSRIIWQLAKIE